MDLDEAIPTENDFAILPRLAAVAFAVRCARRALKGSGGNSMPIGAAMSYAEGFAAGTVGGFAHGNPYAGADVDVMSAMRRDQSVSEAVDAARRAADDAASASMCSRDTDDTRMREHEASLYKQVRRAAYSCVDSLFFRDSEAGLRDLLQDFDWIMELSVSEGWNHDTTVAQSVFEPFEAE